MIGYLILMIICMITDANAEEGDFRPTLRGFGVLDSEHKSFALDLVIAGRQETAWLRLNTELFASSYSEIVSVSGSLPSRSSFSASQAGSRFCAFHGSLEGRLGSYVSLTLSSCSTETDVLKSSGEIQAHGLVFLTANAEPWVLGPRASGQSSSLHSQTRAATSTRGAFAPHRLLSLSDLLRRHSVTNFSCGAKTNDISMHDHGRSALYVWLLGSWTAEIACTCSSSPRRSSAFEAPQSVPSSVTVELFLGLRMLQSGFFLCLE